MKRRDPRDRESQLAALRRELRLRLRSYPKRVAAGTMSQEECDYELAVFKAIVEQYEEAVKSGYRGGGSH